MKKVYIILLLIFLLFLTSCNDYEITIDKDVINDVITSINNNDKIFINVYDKDKMYVPLSHKGKEIIWNYDEKYLSLTNNSFKVVRDGLTIITATYLDKTHIYSVTIKNNIITNTVQYNLNFYYSFINDAKKIGKNITPKKIVFHNTANTAPAVNEIKWLSSKDNTSSTSFHYAVDDTGVYQAIPTTKASYHAGNYKINNESVGIEIAKSKINDAKEKDEGIKNATILIALLMNYYNIKIDDVISHYDASGKHCPHDIFDRYGLEIFYEEIEKLI